MKKILVLAILMLFASFPAFAQGNMQPIKVDEFDPASEGADIFLSRAKVFVKMLSEADKSTTGVISIYSNDELAKGFDGMLSKNPDLRKRISLLEPGRRYNNLPERIGFWLVPEGAGWPFELSCAFCECPSISVDGPDSLFEEMAPRAFAIFTANVSGGAQESIEYHWTVTGGKIDSGQGSPSISVKAGPVWMDDVTATVEIGGIDPKCNCLVTASFTSKMSPK
jgi:hypothetical protein